MSDEKPYRLGRERIARVFRYLKALNEHRNPAKRDLSEQPWTLWFRHLPDHSSIQRRVSNGHQADEEADFVLKVGRPTFTQAPQPPLPIVDWLEGDWDDADEEVAVSEMKPNGAEPLRFYAEPRRVEAYERWKTQHQNWAATERPARAAMKIFEQIYELYGRIEREAEQIELVLGDGILSWKRGEEEASVYHPILLQRSARGQFAEGPPEKEAVDPKIGRAPVLFLRTRTLGFATAIEGTLDDLAVRQDLPLALLKIVGLDPPPEGDEQAETYEAGDEP